MIPCYNVQDYIKNCIESALNQTYKPIEIICIDNNSNDNTSSILSQFESESKLKFINVLIKEQIMQEI